MRTHDTLIKLNIDLSHLGGELSAMIVGRADEIGRMVEQSVKNMVENGTLQRKIDSEVNALIEKKIEDYFRYGGGHDAIRDLLYPALHEAFHGSKKKQEMIKEEKSK